VKAKGTAAAMAQVPAALRDEAVREGGWEGDDDDTASLCSATTATPRSAWLASSVTATPREPEGHSLQLLQMQEQMLALRTELDNTALRLQDAEAEVQQTAAERDAERQRAEQLAGELSRQKQEVRMLQDASVALRTEVQDSKRAVSMLQADLEKVQEALEKQTTEKDVALLQLEAAEEDAKRVAVLDGEKMEMEREMNRLRPLVQDLQHQLAHTQELLQEGKRQNSQEVSRLTEQVALLRANSPNTPRAELQPSHNDNDEEGEQVASAVEVALHSEMSSLSAPAQGAAAAMEAMEGEKKMLQEEAQLARDEAQHKMELLALTGRELERYQLVPYTQQSILTHNRMVC